MAERTIYYDLKAFLVKSYVFEFFYVMSHKSYTLSEQDPYMEDAGDLVLLFFVCQFFTVTLLILLNLEIG